MADLNNNINIAISNGLYCLSGKQNCNGSFGKSSNLITTALAVQAFTNYAESICVDPLNCCFQYFNEINDALTYILQNGHISNNQIYFGSLSNSNETTGAVLSALSDLYNICNYKVNLPGYPLDGNNLNDIINGSISFLAANQNETGGWGVAGGNYDNFNTSSNEVTGFVTNGFLMALNAGFSLPPSVYSGMQNWVDYIQDSCSGGAGDLTPCDKVNIVNTSILIQQMSILNYTCNNCNLQDAFTFIADNWCQPVGYLYPGWNDACNTDYYTTYQLMLLFLQYNTLTLTNSCCKKINWFYNVIDVLLSKQNSCGCWPPSNVNYEQSEEVTSTVYSILSLQIASSKLCS